MTTNKLITGLPGEDLIRRGLADFHAGRLTVAACLIHIARPRLTRAGLVAADYPTMESPEIQLFRLLQQDGEDAYSRYNSLLRELASFENCLDPLIRKRIAPVKLSEPACEEIEASVRASTA
jgi:hypothetical protein